ncbi:MHYT domain-containing protein, partial [Escherichia coli]
GPAIEVGGAIFGLGIAAMHYTGMAAFEIPGVLGWNYPLVALSVVFAAGFGVVAANRIARPVTRFCKYGGTLAMILAIVSLHFTGMAAVTI